MPTLSSSAQPHACGPAGGRVPLPGRRPLIGRDWYPQRAPVDVGGEAGQPWRREGGVHVTGFEVGDDMAGHAEQSTHGGDVEREPSPDEGDGRRQDGPVPTFVREVAGQCGTEPLEGSRAAHAARSGVRADAAGPDSSAMSVSGA
jgi:hypothetical protein